MRVGSLIPFVLLCAIATDTLEHDRLWGWFRLLLGSEQLGLSTAFNKRIAFEFMRLIHSVDSAI